MSLEDEVTEDPKTKSPAKKAKKAKKAKAANKGKKGQEVIQEGDRSRDGAATVAQMKSMPVDDDCFGKYSIRADGRVLVDAHLFAVKKPEESKGPWDLFKLVSTIPGADAFRPLSEGGCSFIAK
jgi:hypothetical protein